jgi:hypothetical protein
LEVGDSFVVRAELGNVEGMDFYIVQCVEWLHVVLEDKDPNAYGFSVNKGDEVIIGLYYKRCGQKESFIQIGLLLASLLWHMQLTSWKGVDQCTTCLIVH